MKNNLKAIKFKNIKFEKVKTEPRNSVLLVRLKQTEKQFVKHDAERLGMTISDYLRMVLTFYCGRVGKARLSDLKPVEGK